MSDYKRAARNFGVLETVWDWQQTALAQCVVSLIGENARDADTRSRCCNGRVRCSTFAYLLRSDGSRHQVKTPDCFDEERFAPSLMRGQAVGILLWDVSLCPTELFVDEFRECRREGAGA